MNDALKLHLDKNYYATIKRSDKMNAVVVKIPDNIILNKNKKEIIYEIDKNRLNVYSCGTKKASIECEDYCLRMVVFADITNMLTNYRIPKKLVAIYDKDGLIKSEDNDIINIIDPPKRKSDKLLESKLLKCFNEIIEEKETEIEDSVKDGFSLIMNVYLKGLIDNE